MLYTISYNIVYHDLRYRISTYDIVYQPTISYIMTYEKEYHDLPGPETDYLFY